MKRNESDEKSKKSKKRSRKSEAEQAKKKWKRSYYTPDCSKEDVRAHQTLKAEFRINPHFNAGESRDSVIMLVKKLIAGDKECVARMKKLEQLGEDHGVDFFRDGIFAGGLVSTLLEEGADLKDKMLGLGMFHFPPDTVNPKQGSLEVTEDRTGWKNQTMNHLFKTILLWYLWVLENKEQVTLTAAEKAAFFDYFLGINRLPAMFEAGIIKQAGQKVGAEEYDKVCPGGMEPGVWLTVQREWTGFIDSLVNIIFHKVESGGGKVFAFAAGNGAQEWRAGSSHDRHAIPHPAAHLYSHSEEQARDFVDLLNKFFTELRGQTTEVKPENVLPHLSSPDCLPQCARKDSLEYKQWFASRRYVLGAKRLCSSSPNTHKYKVTNQPDVHSLIVCCRSKGKGRKPHTGAYVGKAVGKAVGKGVGKGVGKAIGHGTSPAQALRNAAQAGQRKGCPQCDWTCSVNHFRKGFQRHLEISPSCLRCIQEDSEMRKSYKKYLKEDLDQGCSAKELA